jgi:hypothetical protein
MCWLLFSAVAGFGALQCLLQKLPCVLCIFITIYTNAMKLIYVNHDLVLVP